MNFFESELCLTRQYCLVCRDRSTGARWREVVGGIYPTGGPDFECPLKLPWITGAPTAKQRPLFDAAVAAAPQAIPDRKMPGRRPRPRRRTGKIGKLVVEHELKIRAELPQTHEVVIQLDRLAVATLHPRGCKGCTRKRFLRRIGEAVLRAPQEDQDRILGLIGFEA